MASPRPLAFRVEPFGAIVQLAWPRALVFVDRAFARRLAPQRARAAGWSGEQPAVGDQVLSAPLEAHLQLTNQCDVGCQGCYTSATPQPASAEWGLAEWCQALDVLADMRVFHVALGGGESAMLPWLGELVRYARSRGITPNLTTSGLVGLANVIAHARCFGQINVSLDGLGDRYRDVRGVDGFARAHAAILQLRRVHKNVGINVVVTRHNFDQLPALVAYAKRHRLREVEFLRFKPAGRGRTAYEQLVCTQEQHRALFPTLLAAAKRHRMRIRVDCSYTPMIAHHQPSPRLLAHWLVYGCSGGDFLIGAKATGAVSACSFAPPPTDKPDVTQLNRYWQTPGAFGVFRTWRDAAEPCQSCSYHSLCRGGCRVVSRHLEGDLHAPDPECPRVVAYRATHPKRLAIAR